jgi:hypothetical protein
MTTKLFIVVLAMFCCTPVIVLAVDIDSDSDGLSDIQEAKYFTDPNNPDTDGDGFLDGDEVKNDYSPHIGGMKKMHEFDYDKDGLNDWLERWFGSSIGKADTDGDGYNDFDEVMSGHSPVDISTPSKFSRSITIDRTSQRLYYLVDKVRILNLPVSTGMPNTPTPKGDFTVLSKVYSKHYKGAGFDYPNTLWNIEFKKGMFMHTAYWHNDFGIRTRSHGCVNMRVADAELLYKYVNVGFPVSIIGETPKRYYVGT